ncbi:hypothetical protein [Streptosporangium amethystogenes]|uniref:hypothetical protein n=1 Tax=Streptosporangium amethystogenes TaxID=2002 RepID=UPI0004C7A616|nr:hypothetical protein [Streptosporangium amethystogenes]
MLSGIPASTAAQAAGLSVCSASGAGRVFGKGRARTRSIVCHRVYFDQLELLSQLGVGLDLGGHR